MHNLFHLLDLKMSFAGCLFLLVSFSGLETGLKIFGSVIFIGYTVRRWYLLEKNHKEGNNDKNQ